MARRRLVLGEQAQGTRSLRDACWPGGDIYRRTPKLVFIIKTRYHAQGRYAQAEPLYQRALTIWEKALGPEHPHVATSLNNLAGLYEAQGRYAQAEPLYKRSLAILERALGPEHPHVARTLENYAALLRQTARADEAERMEARAKTIRAKSE